MMPLKHVAFMCLEFYDKVSNLTIVSLDYHGLNSPGLTCYLNSILQVLYMTEDFREAVHLKQFVTLTLFLIVFKV